jgi:ubiquinone biosynthesis protein COQ9
VDDRTLDEMRPALATEVARHAGFDGWTPVAIDRAAQGLSIAPEVARLAFPGGARDMIDAWFATIDTEMLANCPPEKLKSLKVRAKITALVEARLALLAPRREALRRAQAILTMPQNAASGLKLGWRAADVMWRAAGDVAMDYNHYTKRAILGSVYGATLMVFVDDVSDDWADTRAFLARRIDGIMRFEVAKAKLLSPDRPSFSLSRFIGRLRYPAV